MSDFVISARWATPHAVWAACELPDTPDPVPTAVLKRLHPVEAEHARTLRKYRQIQFVGGRLALRAAATHLGHPLEPVLSDNRGAPAVNSTWTASISHKRTLAVSAIALREGGTLGIDLEDYDPARPTITGKILTPAETEAIAELPDRRAWIATLLRFSIKESIYKALDPFLRRYIDFHEAEVWPNLDGTAQVTLKLRGEQTVFSVDARYDWFRGRIYSSVRIMPLSGSHP